jgi:guanine deaminase
MNDHQAFMREAIALSRDNMHANHGGPFGAVVVKDGQIIGRGANRVTSAHDPTAHAEIEAIRETCRHLGDFHLRGCAIYTSCEPCPMCLAAIYWARLDKIFYANTQHDAASIDCDDAFLYEQIALPMDQRLIPCTPYSQNIRTHVFTVGYESIHTPPSTCLLP